MLSIHYIEDNKIKIIWDIDIIKNILTSNKVFYLKSVDPTDDEIQFLKNLLKLHNITIDNYITEKHLPKVEEYENYISTVMYDIDENKTANECNKINPVCIIMADNIVLTLSKWDFKGSEEILSRLSNTPELSFNSSCYLYYIILDTLVDGLFPMLTSFENELDELQEHLFKNDVKDCTEKIINIRRRLLKLGTLFTYEKEVLYKLSHEKYRLIDVKFLSCFKDVFHHLEKLNSIHREYTSWSDHISNAYDSYSSTKLNDKVQMLTIVSFIFLPLSFLTGWYGMNFINMPELQYNYGYLFFIMAVTFITISMIIYFKKKKLL